MIDIQFLKDFVLQSYTGNLRTKNRYPSEIEGLTVKVSFGFGKPVLVPWIALLGPGMQASNGFYPAYLFYKKENALLLTYETSETNDPARSWPLDTIGDAKKVTEIITARPKFSNSFVFKCYTPMIKNDAVSFWSEGKEISDEVIAEDLMTMIRQYKDVC